jgi:SAM-dependent methyltransferase
MNNSPVADVVSQQYSKWTYPEPIVDLPDWLKNNWQWFDPSHSSRLFWPDQDRSDLDILIAGCGTNQAAVIAFNNPGSRVLAVDVSPQSLQHESFLKEKYQLSNLELKLLPIEELPSLKRHFDLIISTGVLHHMASPQIGMNSLAECLKHDGVAAIMLYAKFGRLGVYMMQEVFRELGLAQDEPSLQIVKDAVAALPADHPLRSYTKIAPDLGFDAGIVDTFLHGRDRDFTIAECRELVAKSGLVFQDLLFKTSYHPPISPPTPFMNAVTTRSKEQQWNIMERINFRNGCHFFLACRPERPATRYQVDFSSEAARQYVPDFRYRCRLQGNTVFKPGDSLVLSAAHAELLRLVDGKRTLEEIADEMGRQGLYSGIHPSQRKLWAFKTAQELWQRDYLLMKLPARG